MTADERRAEMNRLGWMWWCGSAMSAAAAMDLADGTAWLWPALLSAAQALYAIFWWEHASASTDSTE